MPQETIDLIPDGVVVADDRCRAVMANEVAARMLGLSSKQVAGRPLGEVLRLQNTEGQDWLSHNRPYRGLRSRTGVPEQAWLLPDGSEVLVAARLHRAWPRGPVDRIAVSLRSGRGRARLDRERSDLVATVAHELRSPLTGVKGFVQALLSRWDKLNDEQKKLMLNTVHADADRLSRLIVELLDAARIDTGRLQLHQRPSDAGVLAGRVVESARAVTSRPIELELTDGPGEIWVDPDKFTQVATNLVENAIRHGSGTVTVRVDRAADPLRLIVDDEGQGVAEEIRHRVFTKFWRSGSSGGSGLGLYIVGGLVRAHGGQVLLEESPAGGARIITTWPRPTRADDPPARVQDP